MDRVEFSRESLRSLSEAEQLAVALQLFFTPRRRERRPRDAALLASGEALAIAAPLAVTAWGSGPPVLLVHGWEGQASDMGALIPPLVAQGRRVVAFDAPAHGDSPGTESNLVAFYEAILAVGSALGPLAGIAGYSLGGTATAIALDRGLVAGRGVLIAAPARVASLAERFLTMLGLPGRLLPTFLARVEQKVGRSLAELDVDHLAGRLQVPALLIHDRSDREVPLADAEAIVRAWPGARLITTSNLGHRRILLARQVVAAVTDFLLGG